MLCRVAAGISLVLIGFLAGAGPGRADDGTSLILPSCEAALDEVASAFREKESRFWDSNLRILNFADVHETAFRPWSAQVATRRFCSAEAQISDGVRRPVHFSIEFGMGEIGATWGVQWCVVGLDRNWAYNPSCRMARP